MADHPGAAYFDFVAPSFALFCFGFLGVFAFLSTGTPPVVRDGMRRRYACVGAIRSTKSARQAGASNGLAKYSVIRAILPSRASPIPT